MVRSIRAAFGRNENLIELAPGFHGLVRKCSTGVLGPKVAWDSVIYSGAKIGDIAGAVLRARSLDL